MAKVEGRVMTTADHICDALDAKPTVGVTNCALRPERDAAQEKCWKDALNTGKLASIASQKKEDMFHIEMVWAKGLNGQATGAAPAEQTTDAAVGQAHNAPTGLVADESTNWR